MYFVRAEQKQLEVNFKYITMNIYVNQVSMMMELISYVYLYVVIQQQLMEKIVMMVIIILMMNVIIVNFIVIKFVMITFKDFVFNCKKGLEIIDINQCISIFGDNLLVKSEECERQQLDFQ
ncbi:unnamed protein product [Paramecium primaurelia]|uniref:Transmembrane protein n=1 Tax=Paramecium primaurelia TaxID=5886 RepID=A0A8S1QQE7_PARPR|nr:unnamed protein product [Paramecium primaurelia]